MPLEIKNLSITIKVTNPVLQNQIAKNGIKTEVPQKEIREIFNEIKKKQNER